MASLAECGRKHGLSKSEIDNIMSLSKQLRLEGYEGENVIQKALGEIIEDFEDELGSIIKQIRNAIETDKELNNGD